MQSQQQKVPKLEIAQRPKESPTIGEIIKIETNFWKVKFDYPKIYSYSFEVSIQENQEQKVEKSKIFKVFNKLRENDNFSPDTFLVYAENVVYSSTQIDDESLNVDMEGKKYIVTIKYSEDIDFSPLKRCFEENYQLLNSENLNLLRILNTYLNFEVRTNTNYLTLGRKTFQIPKRPNRLRSNFNFGLIHEFYQSVRIGWDQLLVNTDVCSAIYNIRSKKLISLDPILHDDMIREMIRMTAIKPNDRFNKIDKGIKEVYKHESDKGLKSISFSVDNDNGFMKLN
ncbi:15604_t:CDS:2, partial [Dentiscutata heterogama]